MYTENEQPPPSLDSMLEEPCAKLSEKQAALMLKRINTLDKTLDGLEEALAAAMEEIRKNTKNCG